ncbi:MAG: hypothetical protein HQ539_03535 [Parcubacteria group bacterium]|nr:hypothetical protein [Parcubacteria group bacterium]
MKYKIFILVVLVFLVCASYTLAQNTPPVNAGFVSGIWFSQSTFFANQKVRAYSAIQNQSSFDILGKVEFYDNETLIDSSNFSAISNRLIEVWADWTPTYGNHEIYAKIVEIKKSEIGKSPEDIILPNTISTKYEIFIDEDTDEDRIGNKDDPDDDNDGISDVVEIAQNSDPLVKDSKPVNTNNQNATADSSVHQGAGVTLPVQTNEGNIGDEIDDSDYVFQQLKKRVNGTMTRTSEKLAEFAKLKIEPAKERVKRKIEHESSTPKKATNYLWLAALGVATKALNSKNILYLALFIAIFFIIIFITKLLKRSRS